METITDQSLKDELKSLQRPLEDEYMGLYTECECVEEELEETKEKLKTVEKKYKEEAELRIKKLEAKLLMLDYEGAFTLATQLRHALSHQSKQRKTEQNGAKLCLLVLKKRQFHFLCANIQKKKWKFHENVDIGYRHYSKVDSTKTSSLGNTII